MSIGSVDFEVDGEGPKFKFGIWERPEKKLKSLAERLVKTIKDLDIRNNAADLAAARIPAVDSDQPCSFEQEIDNGLQLILDDEAASARAALEVNGSELSALGTDLTDSSYASNQARLEGELATLETDLEATLHGPMRDFVDSETQLNQFNIKHGTANQPTAGSAFLWLASTIVTAIVEAVLNTFLFRGDMGVGPGAQFAFIVGLAFACIGTLAGIGVSQIIRDNKGMRRVIGGVVLLVAAVGGVLFMMKIGQFRASLGDDAGQQGASGMSAVFSAPLIPYAILNLAGVALVAWKAIPVFGYRDLKRLRDTYKVTSAEVANLRAKALSGCEDERRAARGQAEVIASTAQANAARGNDLASCDAIIKAFEAAQDRLSDARISCQLKFREVVTEVHPQGGEHIRFKTPPARFRDIALTVEPRFAAIAHALEARSVTMRGELGGALTRIDAAANTAKERIGQSVADIEATTRASRGGMQNVFRFKRAGGSA